MFDIETAAAAVAAAYLILAMGETQVLRNRRVIHWIDNTAALHSFVKGQILGSCGLPLLFVPPCPLFFGSQMFLVVLVGELEVSSVYARKLIVAKKEVALRSKFTWMLFLDGFHKQTSDFRRIPVSNKLISEGFHKKNRLFSGSCFFSGIPLKNINMLYGNPF